MSYTYTLNLSGTDGSETVTGAPEVTADGVDKRSIEVPAGESVDVTMEVFASLLKALVILSDVDVEVETTGGSGSDEITASANRPVIWYDSCGLPNPITDDRSGFTITNNGSQDATVTIHVAQDATGS